MKAATMMPSGETRTSAGVAIATLVVLALLVLALIVAGLNDQRAAWAAAHEAPALLGTGIFVSRFGLSGYMLLLSAATTCGAAVVMQRTIRPVTALRARRLSEQAAFFFAAIAVSGLACQAIKHLVGRARPRFLTKLGPFHFAGPSVHSGFDSFPSGHTTTAFAAALALSILLPSWRLAFYGAALLIGVARVLAEAHYPSDVVAGAVLGTLATLWVARTFAARDLAFPVYRPPNIDRSTVAIWRGPT